MTVNLAPNPVAVEPLAATDPALQRFLQQLGTGSHEVNASRWMRLVLAKPTSTGGREGALDASAASATSSPSSANSANSASGRAQRVVVRPLTLRGQECLNFVYSHVTQDITKNLPWAEGLQRIQELLGAQFRNAHLFTAGEEIQLSLSKRGRGYLSSHAAEHPAPVGPSPAAHDREKRRWLALDRPFLVALGVTTAQHQLVPAMARKWKQINKFLEVLDHALQLAGLLPDGRVNDTGIESDAPKAPLRVVDFGAGKAYLTFAVHDWLVHSLSQAAQVSGFELRADLVQQGNAAIAQLGLQGLQMQQGDVRMVDPPAMDVMIALHACDTATDHAIHLGLRAGARVILCSPCCHKELRPQLLSPHPLRSVFQHGIHAEQTAEMVTDSLRALLLQAQGYETQVFEFVALEHTRKNKMILAVKRGTPGAGASVHDSQHEVKIRALAQLDELKSFFGVRQQCLETLLMDPPSAA